MEFQDMSKKEFKDYINKNWFFVNFNATKINKNDLEEKLNNNKWKLMWKMPKVDDNILVFEWVLSQNYGLWEKNRNWYKIDPNGWDFSDYKNNPIILLQHNHENGWIGRAVKFDINESWDLTSIFYVDLNTLDEKTRYQIENWYISSVSTSHITIEDMVEDNKTGKRMTREEAMEEWVDVRWVLFWYDENYTLVVTKANMIENSMVTIWSNEKAIVSHNSVWNYFTNKYINTLELTDEKKNELLQNNFLSNDIKTMIKKTNDVKTSKSNTKVDETKVNETNVEETKADETKADETKTDETKVEETKVDETKVDETKVEETKDDETKVEETKVDETKNKVSENNDSSENDETKAESENDEVEKSENDENTAENFVREVVDNSIKSLKENDLIKLDETISWLENKIKEQEKTISTLVDWLTVMSNKFIEMNNTFNSVITNWVSVFVEKKEKKVELNSLTSKLQELKSM